MSGSDVFTGAYRELRSASFTKM